MRKHLWLILSSIVSPTISAIMTNQECVIDCRSKEAERVCKAVYEPRKNSNSVRQAYLVKRMGCRVLYSDSGDYEPEIIAVRIVENVRFPGRGGVSSLSPFVRGGGIRTVAMHRADELSDGPIAWYDDVDFVLRNYYDESRLKRGQAMWMPIPPALNGPVPLDGHTWQPASERAVWMTFVGANGRSGPNGTRRGRSDMFAAALALLDEVSNYSMDVQLDRKHCCGTPKESTGQAYLDRLAQAIFALVPCGNNMESYRFWEAISTGTIVIQEVCEPPHRNFVRGIHSIVPNATIWTVMDWQSELPKYSPQALRRRAKVLSASTFGAWLDAQQRSQQIWYKEFDRIYGARIRSAIYGLPSLDTYRH